MSLACENVIERLAELWGLSADEQRTQSLALIQTVYPYNAFADESRQTRLGPQDYPAIFGVAAYVATFDRWLKLAEEWNGMLRKFQVPLDDNPNHIVPFFHMTDFIARQKQFENNWSDKKRDEFMELLTLTASEHTVAGIACSVDEIEYERILPQDAKAQFREPYFFCLWGVLSALCGLENRFPIVLPKPVWCLFDNRKKAVELAAGIFYTTKKLRSDQTLGEMAFAEMWRTPQLQAADLLTYEAVHRALEERHAPDKPKRKSLERLERKGNLFFIHLDEERLARYVQLVREAVQIQSDE